MFGFFFFQAEDGIRDRSPSRGLGDVYKRQIHKILTYLTWDIIQYDILNCKRFLKKMSKCVGENQLVIQFDKGGIKGYNHYINIIELEI